MAELRGQLALLLVSAVPLPRLRTAFPPTFLSGVLLLATQHVMGGLDQHLHQLQLMAVQPYAFAICAAVDDNGRIVGELARFQWRFALGAFELACQFSEWDHSIRSGFSE